MPTLLISEIKVRDRHRKDMGDIDDLASSIREIGLLVPVLVDADNLLIDGMRRLAAAKQLRFEKINAHVVKDIDDARKRLLAERDVNVCRKPFTPSEAAAIGMALEALQKPKAEERKKAGTDTSGTAGGRGRKKPSGKLPEGLDTQKSPENSGNQQDTRDKVAEAIGMSGRTYEKAKAVTQAAKDDPEHFGDLIDQMDESGKVSPAYKELQRRQSESAPDTEPSDEHQQPPDLLDEAEQAIPEQAYEAFNQIPEIRQLASQCEKLVKEVERVCLLPVGRCLTKTSIVSQIRSAKQSISGGKPAYVCPYCRGKKKDCTACAGHGWVTAHTWKQAPPEMKEIQRGKKGGAA